MSLTCFQYQEMKYKTKLNLQKIKILSKTSRKNLLYLLTLA